MLETCLFELDTQVVPFNKTVFYALISLLHEYNIPVFNSNYERIGNNDAYGCIHLLNGYCAVRYFSVTQRLYLNFFVNGREIGFTDLVFQFAGKNGYRYMSRLTEYLK